MSHSGKFPFHWEHVTPSIPVRTGHSFHSSARTMYLTQKVMKTSQNQELLNWVHSAARVSTMADIRCESNGFPAQKGSVCEVLSQENPGAITPTLLLYGLGACLEVHFPPLPVRGGSIVPAPPCKNQRLRSRQCGSGGWRVIQ